MQGMGRWKNSPKHPTYPTPPDENHGLGRGRVRTSGATRPIPRVPETAAIQPASSPQHQPLEIAQECVIGTGSGWGRGDVAAGYRLVAEELPGWGGAADSSVP